MFTGLLTGLVLMLLGHSHLGRIVRFFPYPVICDFFAGVGNFLLKGGLFLAARQSLQFGQISYFLHTDVLPLWVAALAFRLVLYLFGRIIRLWLVMPMALLLGVVVFYGVVFGFGYSLDQASRAGWLPHIIDMSVAVPVLSLVRFGAVHWDIVLHQFDYMSLAALICAITYFSVLRNSWCGYCAKMSWHSSRRE